MESQQTSYAAHEGGRVARASCCKIAEAKAKGSPSLISQHRRDRSLRWSSTRRHVPRPAIKLYYCCPVNVWTRQPCAAADPAPGQDKVAKRTKGSTARLEIELGCRKNGAVCSSGVEAGQHPCFWETARMEDARMRRKERC